MIVNTRLLVEHASYSCHARGTEGSDDRHVNMSSDDSQGPGYPDQGIDLTTAFEHNPRTGESKIPCVSRRVLRSRVSQSLTKRGSPNGTERAKLWVIQVIQGLSIRLSGRIPGLRYRHGLGTKTSFEVSWKCEISRRSCRR